MNNNNINEIGSEPNDYFTYQINLNNSTNGEVTTTTHFPMRINHFRPMQNDDRTNAFELETFDVQQMNLQTISERQMNEQVNGYGMARLGDWIVESLNNDTDIANDDVNDDDDGIVIVNDKLCKLTYMNGNVPINYWIITPLFGANRKRIARYRYQVPKENDLFGNLPAYHYFMLIRFLIEEKYVKKEILDGIKLDLRNNFTLFLKERRQSMETNEIVLQNDFNELQTHICNGNCDNHEQGVVEYCIKYSFAIPKNKLSQPKISKGGKGKFSFVLKYNANNAPLFTSNEIIVVSKLPTDKVKVSKLDIAEATNFIKQNDFSLGNMDKSYSILRDIDENSFSRTIYSFKLLISGEKKKIKFPNNKFEQLVINKAVEKYISDNANNLKYITKSKRNISISYDFQKKEVYLNFSGSNKNLMENRISSFIREESWETIEKSSKSKKKRKRNDGKDKGYSKKPKLV